MNAINLVVEDVASSAQESQELCEVFVLQGKLFSLAVACCYFVVSDILKVFKLTGLDALPRRHHEALLINSALSVKEYVLQRNGVHRHVPLKRELERLPSKMLAANGVEVVAVFCKQCLWPNPDGEVVSHGKHEDNHDVSNRSLAGTHDELDGSCGVFANFEEGKHLVRPYHEAVDVFDH